MKIAVDARLLKNPAGVGNYLKNILLHLLKIDPENQYHLLFNEEIPELFKESNVSYHKLQLSHLKTWSGLCKKFCLEKDITLYFTPVISFPRSDSIRVINTLHDFVWKIIPGYSFFEKMHNNLWIKRSGKKKNLKMILVSPHLKGLLQNYFPGFPENKLIVLPHSVPKFTEVKINAEDFLNRHGINKKFFLSVGTTFTRKNQRNIIKAFLSSGLSNTMQLVIAGLLTDLGRDLLKEFAEPVKNKRVVFTEYLNDDILRILYEKTIAVVYPSLCEGFGLPILEANYFKKPIITSNFDPFIWVAGNSGLFVDPYNPNEIREKMEYIINSPAECEEKVKLGTENLKRFSWEKNVQILLDLINNP